MLIHNTVPITPYKSLLTFRDTDKKFELKRDFLKIITNRKYNVDLASLSDKKLRQYFAKEMYFDVKPPGKISTRDRTFMKLLKPPAIVASGVSTKFLPSDPNKLCDRLELLLEKKTSR